jgi:serpin B
MVGPAPRLGRRHGTWNTMPASAPPARPTNRARLAFAIGALVVTVSACIGTTPTGQTIRSDAPRHHPNQELLPSAVKASNSFAIDLYHASGHGQGNFVSSPYAVMLALGMSRAGSGGTTRDQFDAVLHKKATPDLDEGLNTIDQVLATRSGAKSSTTRKGRITASLDASVWGQRGTRFTSAYLDILSTDYGSPVHVVDFQSDAESAREAINQWGSDATQGRISDVVPRGDVTAFTRFLPVAVSYLRAPWQVPFDPAMTRTGSFEKLDGETVEVRTMQVASPSGVLTAEGSTWRAVDVPYLGAELSLLIVEPRGSTFEDLERSFDRILLDAVVEALADEPVDLRIPLFQFTTSGDLTDELESMGLTDAFDRSADFSGITSDEVLDLSGVAYQGYFGVDEEGTDAETTANATVKDAPAPGAEKVTVDRPFVFAVRDRETGLVLFMGRVVSPG